MTRLIWRLFVYFICRKAMKDWGPSQVKGALFTTATFQQAFLEVTGAMPDSHVVDGWLCNYGYNPDPNNGDVWYKHAPIMRLAVNPKTDESRYYSVGHKLPDGWRWF